MTRCTRRVNKPSIIVLDSYTFKFVHGVTPQNILIKYYSNLSYLLCLIYNLAYNINVKESTAVK